jgi:hypothetical protein
MEGLAAAYSLEGDLRNNEETFKNRPVCRFCSDGNLCFEQSKVGF